MSDVDQLTNAALSDLEIFRDLLTRSGIPFMETPRTAGADGTWLHERASVAIHVPKEEPGIGADDHPAIAGYSGFYSGWFFDDAGGLIATGAWE